MILIWVIMKKLAEKEALMLIVWSIVIILRGGLNFFDVIMKRFDDLFYAEERCLAISATIRELGPYRTGARLLSGFLKNKGK